MCGSWTLVRIRLLFPSGAHATIESTPTGGWRITMCDLTVYRPGWAVCNIDYRQPEWADAEFASARLARSAVVRAVGQPVKSAWRATMGIPRN